MDSKTEPASEAKEHYPFTGLEKRAVNYVATDDLAMFADGDTRMIYEHYYIKGSEIENSKLLEEITRLKAELERERENVLYGASEYFQEFGGRERFTSLQVQQVLMSLIKKAKN